ncbi:unnamed protein product [Candidula unifasciata]|uniref:EF-hand domain-containing protein n=1 Tax=Candidula unifasciata TaxID=100452 RepID=A0A8S3YWW8_9EUPU|nr:unnamed protein product [Candidula unifasciata]
MLLHVCLLLVPAVALGIFKDLPLVNDLPTGDISELQAIPGALTSLLGKVGLGGDNGLGIAEAKNLLKNADTDGDGIVITAELSATFPGLSLEEIGAFESFFDGDNISGISGADIEITIQKYDTDGNGYIDPSELDVAGSRGTKTQGV